MGIQGVLSAIRMSLFWVHVAVWACSLSPAGSQCVGKLHISFREDARKTEHELLVVLTRGGIRPLTLPSWGAVEWSRF